MRSARPARLGGAAAGHAAAATRAPLAPLPGSGRAEARGRWSAALPRAVAVCGRETRRGCAGGAAAGPCCHRGRVVGWAVGLSGGPRMRACGPAESVGLCACAIGAALARATLVEGGAPCAGRPARRARAAGSASEYSFVACSCSGSGLQKLRAALEGAPQESFPLGRALVGQGSRWAWLPLGMAPKSYEQMRATFAERRAVCARGIVSAMQARVLGHACWGVSDVKYR